MGARLLTTTHQFLQGLGTDTVTAQDQLTPTVEASTSYTRGTIGTYTPVTPFRICDTRPVAPGIAPNQCNTGAGSGPLQPGVSRYLTIDGRDGVPCVWGHCRCAEPHCDCTDPKHQYRRLPR